MKIPTVEETAREHQAADARCGREWNSGYGCGCGACTIMRKRLRIKAAAKLARDIAIGHNT